MKRVINFIIIVCIILICACTTDPETVKVTGVTGVTLNQSEISLVVDTQLTLIATVTPSNATNKNVVWSSSDTTVATISWDGHVFALSEGTTTIAVTTQDGNKTATCEITVINTPATGVTLNLTTHTMFLTWAHGSGTQLKATVVPQEANPNVTWSSSNTAVAIVNNNGIVYAVSEGLAIITATTRGGNKTAICTVEYFTVPSNRCRTGTPNWGASLGTVNFATNQQWTISGNGITQIWSDAVTATNCQKTSWNGVWGVDHLPMFDSDCRSNPNQKGDLFSWCAVVRFQDQLCPAPWRVPTQQDFINLDRALGGTGNANSTNTTLFNRYLNDWGGWRYEGNINIQTAFYWSSTQYNAQQAYNLRLVSSTEHTNPQYLNNKQDGLSLRCVR